ncbi:MAG: SIMPL domain-containing protein [Verrucomicrobiota bacterium]
MNFKFFPVLFLFVCSFANAFGQYAPPPPQINVSGSAEVKVAPDEIWLDVSVETRSETLDPARIENDGKIAQALKFLKASGIKEKDVQTDFISVQPDYDSNRSRIVPVAYIVQKSMKIRLTTVTNFQTVLTGLLKNGVNRVNDVDFRTTQLRKYRDQARAMAVRAAKEKAQALMSELGAKLGKPYNISAADNMWSYRGYGNRVNNYNNMAQNMSQGGGTSTPSDDSENAFAIGQISVSASVNVSFLIE